MYTYRNANAGCIRTVYSAQNLKLPTSHDPRGPDRRARSSRARFPIRRRAGRAAAQLRPTCVVLGILKHIHYVIMSDLCAAVRRHLTSGLLLQLELSLRAVSDRARLVLRLEDLPEVIFGETPRRIPDRRCAALRVGR